ncbi:MAG: hypothetical protein WDZ52_02385 [Pseudohongiellaceae bacterium]
MTRIRTLKSMLSQTVAVWDQVDTQGKRTLYREILLIACCEQADTVKFREYNVFRPSRNSNRNENRTIQRNITALVTYLDVLILGGRRYPALVLQKVDQRQPI